MNLTTFDTSRQGHAYARARDERIEWLLDTHPVTAAMLVAIGLFPTKGKALRRLNRLVEKGSVLLVGTVCRNVGRPEHVFCRWRPKTDDLLHEVKLTDLCLKLHAAEILRGPQIVDEGIRPDAEVWINGRLFHLELDCGTMGVPQILQRFEVYEGSENLVLWVCATEKRREVLRRRAEQLESIALFTTFAEAVADPHAAIWLDYHGTRAALPRQKKE